MPLGAYVAALALFLRVPSQIVSGTAAERPQNRRRSATAPPVQRVLVHTPAAHCFPPGYEICSLDMIVSHSDLSSRARGSALVQANLCSPNFIRWSLTLNTCSGQSLLLEF